MALRPATVQPQDYLNEELKTLMIDLHGPCCTVWDVHFSQVSFSRVPKGADMYARGKDVIKASPQTHCHEVDQSLCNSLLLTESACFRSWA